MPAEMKESFSAEELIFQIKRLNLQMSAQLEVNLKSRSMTGVQVYFMVYILRHHPEGTYLTELCRETGISKPTLSALIKKLKEKDLEKFRRNDIGFVFQFYNLMPSLTAYENVYLASSLVKEHFEPKEVLKLVGLENRLNNFPSQLSGGEQQRVAIARAIVKNPTLILADEPTGALDSKTSKQIISLLKSICEEQHKTVIIVTHNKAISVIANRIIKVQDGKIISNEKIEKPLDVENIER